MHNEHELVVITALDELKDSIQREIKCISVEKLMHVNADFFRRCQMCNEENEQHLQLLLWGGYIYVSNKQRCRVNGVVIARRGSFWAAHAGRAESRVQQENLTMLWDTELFGESEYCNFRFELKI